MNSKEEKAFIDYSQVFKRRKSMLEREIRNRRVIGDVLDVKQREQRHLDHIGKFIMSFSVSFFTEIYSSSQALLLHLRYANLIK